MSPYYWYLNNIRNIPAKLNTAKAELAATNIGIYALFGGRIDSNNDPTNVVDVYQYN